MGLSEECKNCLYRRQQEKVQQNQEELQCVVTKDNDRFSIDKLQEMSREYLEKVREIIESATKSDTAPVVTERISKLHEEYYHTKYSFEALKQSYNQVMLEKVDEIKEKIEKSADPLKAAILFARVGNYIDFGALGSVDDEKLDELLGRALKEELDQQTYNKFKDELRKAKRLVYLTDNCGEIVLDRLLIEQIKKYHKECEVITIVRGESVLNDATMTDADMVGMKKVSKVYGNGTGIAGTSLPHINEESRRMIESADLIISKGQGNFETLNHCGFNIYYLFLCKCSHFTKRFGLKKYTGVFVRDKDLCSKKSSIL